MRNIRREDVPDYLERGELFEALDPDDDGIFEVPHECFKLTHHVQSKDDLFHLLRSLSYWQVKVIPQEAFSFIYWSDVAEILEEFPSFASTFIPIKRIKEANANNKISTALQEKQGLKMVLWLRANTDSVLTAGACAAAAWVDDLESLTYLHETGCPWNESTIKAAIINGNRACLQYAQTHNCPTLSGSATMALAIKSGQLEVLKHLRRTGGQWDESTMLCAVKFDQLACMKYLHEEGCPWTVNVCLTAALLGRLACLTYAHEQGCAWDLRIPYSAASTGQLACLQYAHEQGCEWDMNVTYLSAKHNHLSCLVYAHEHGCPWHPRTTLAAFVAGNVRCLWYAARHGASYWKVAGYAVLAAIALFDIVGMLTVVIENLCGNFSLGEVVVAIGFLLILFSSILYYLVVSLRHEFAVHVSLAKQRRLGYVGVVLFVLGLVDLITVACLHSKWF